MVNGKTKERIKYIRSKEEQRQGRELLTEFLKEKK